MLIGNKSAQIILRGDVDAVTRTLLEDTGHYLESEVNNNYVPDDERAICISLVLEKELNKIVRKL